MSLANRKKQAKTNFIIIKHWFRLNNYNSNSISIDDLIKIMIHLAHQNKKYPRAVTLSGKVWIRIYSKPEAKYFWSQCSCEYKVCLCDSTSWNPWYDNGLIAPWITSKEKWTKFKDDNGCSYYYNYSKAHSTYKRPEDYKLNDIDYDSMDDDPDLN